MEQVFLIAVLVLSPCFCLAGGDSNDGNVGEDLPGHMQPLGSHMPPEYVKRVSDLPTPSQFVEQYLHTKQPVVFEGLIKNLDVKKKWADDDYLREQFGEEVMGVEQGKKENRSEYAFYLTMKEFLDDYKSDNVYMVSALPTPMFSEWQLPKFLLCGGFTDHLMFIYIWFSSGGTKSVLHSDSYHNLHCLISGRKEFVIIEPHYADLIGPEHEQKGYYDIDIDRVDMKKYPNLAKVPWYNATVNEGDCLYIPYLWLHHVSSFGRNMGVNVWWTQFQFDPEDCSDEDRLPDFSSLGDFALHPELQVKEAMFQMRKKDGSVHADDVLTMLETNERVPGVGKEEVHKLLDILEPGCNGVVKNIDKVPLKHYKEAFEFIVDAGNKYYEEEMESIHDKFHEGYSDPNMEFDGYSEDGGTEQAVFEGGGDYELPSQQHKRDEL